MKLKSTILILAVCILVLLHLTPCDAQNRQKRSPQKYDDYYDKFITRHFADINGKYLDGKEEYKNASNDEEEEEEESSSEDGGEEKSSYEEDDEGDSKSDVQEDHSFNYRNSNDYERIKALSEQQVAELHKKPGNCKQFEKDGMICSQCKDPETGDHSESCAYSSEPNDKKIAYTSRKNHNYKAPQVEASEDASDDTEDEESEDEEEKAVNPSPKGPKPLKQHKSELQDANDYGAYRLAGYTSDIDDEEPKFAHYSSGPKSEKLIELLPTQSYNSKSNQFQGRNLNQALTDFETKDWSNCNKVMKGELTCYYCKDARGATQEECMFVSSTNPKNIRVERHESQKYDTNSRKPLSTVPTIISTTIKHSAPIKIAPIVPNKQEQFARLRMARPLMPTKATKAELAEPLVTPKSSFELHFGEELNPTVSSFKKTIKRTILNKHKKVTDFIPLESRVVAFESHVNHDE